MTIEFGALAVAHDLVEIGGHHADEFLGLFAMGLIEAPFSQGLAQFVDEFARKR